MADTIRTVAALQTLLADGGAPKNITPQKIRDMLVSLQSIMSPPYVALTDASTVTWATGGVPISHATLTIGGNRTLSITGAINGSSGTLIVTQDGTGSRTLTLPATSKTPGGSFALSTAAGAIDTLGWSYTGSVYIWTIGKACA